MPIAVCGNSLRLAIGMRTSQTWVFGAVLALIAATASAAVSVALSHVVYSWREAQARGQVKVFAEVSDCAKETDVRELIERLEYIYNYYPTGTLQGTGSHLDSIVEDARAIACGRIILRLKIITNENLGESPEDWIGKFRNNPRR